MSPAAQPSASPAEPATTVRVVGVDVGGTTIKAAAMAVTPGGTPEEAPRMQRLGPSLRRPTPRPANDPREVLDTVLALVGDVTEELTNSLAGKGNPAIDGIGAVVPGIIDEAAGVAVTAAGLGWSNTPVVAEIERATGVPTALGHDVRAGGLAEWRIGAARGARDALFVMLGTGIGSAVICDGRLLTGDGYAGQLGHTVIDPNGPECGCGQRGCLGRYASAGAVVRLYNDRAKPDHRADGARDVAARARAGDPIAREVWDNAVDALVTGLITAITTFGSRRIVLGGGLSLAGEQLLGPVARELEARRSFQRPPTLVAAELGDESGILGSALLAAAAASRRQPPATTSATTDSESRPAVDASEGAADPV